MTMIGQKPFAPVRRGQWVRVAQDAAARIAPRSPVVIGPAAGSGVTGVDHAWGFATIGPASSIRIAPSTDRGPFTVVPSGATVTVGPSTGPAAMIGPTRPVSVEPPRRGAWAERGWTVRNDVGKRIYEGDYRVRGREFRGRIQVDGGGSKCTAYIHNPPAEVRKHRVGPCFQQCGIGSGWFVLHWRHPARNVDEAILYVERVLDEALNP